MMINLRFNNTQTSFSAKNDKLLKNLECRANIANYRAPELSDFYNNSAKFINKEIKKKEFLNNTSDTIRLLNKKNTHLDPQEAYFFRNISQTLQLSNKTKIPTEYLKNLLKIFSPTDRI